MIDFGEENIQQPSSHSIFSEGWDTSILSSLHNFSHWKKKKKKLKPEKPGSSF
jgi:hypothetical protein